MNHSQDASEQAEYAVYRTLIESWYLHQETRLVVIQDHEDLELWGENLDHILLSVKKTLPEVTEEILDDFKAKNRQLLPVKPLFALSVACVLISTQDINDIFRADGEGWDGFYRRYPGSQGVITLSRVGFNGKRDQALVYIGSQSHWRSGSGHYVFLIEQDGVWRVHSDTLTWIS